MQWRLEQVTTEPDYHRLDAGEPSRHATHRLLLASLFLVGRRGLPKEVQITGDLSMSHKLLVEAFAAQNPPTSYHAELPRKLEIWLVPQVRRATGVRVLGFGLGRVVEPH